jgi:TolB-like protein/Flp pilus assembly protein TadD
MSLIAELKRRNVIRMAGLYLVGAWLLVQVAGTVLPMFGAPAWLPRSVVILLALGFVPALVFAWVFELTPKGLRRDSKISPAESVAPQTAQRLNRMIVAVLALALLYFGFDKFVLAPRRDAALVAATAQAVSAGVKAQAKPDVNRNSIAVLPFVNMSGDVANEYFSDGISEEILNVLAGAPELQVAARTSSFSFKGKPMEVPAIARELQVRMVLEGSVRKQGDKVRITAQLIDAKTGFHVWSQTYDRKLEDIFAIQDEIAKAIGDELKVKIGGADKPGHDAGGTKNLEAYDLYLQGMSLWHARNEKDLWESISVFEKAVAIDPGFAQAYAGLALAYAVLGDYSSRITYAESLARSNNFAELALALDPALPEPYAAMGNNAAAYRQWLTSDALLRRAIAIRPSFASAYQWRGLNQIFAGDLEAGRATLERASQLDPRSPVIGDNHAMALLILGRYEEAMTICQRVFEFAPDYPYCLEDASLAALLSGDYATARAMLDRLAAAINPSAVGEGKRVVDALQGRADRHALAVWLASLPHYSRTDTASRNALSAISIPSVLVLLGEHDLALDFMERISNDLGNDLNFAILPRVMDALRCQPRFRALVDRIKATDPYAAKVCAGKP